MKRDLDFGVLLALAYVTFVDELRAHLNAAGFGNLHRSFGYVARALDEGPLTLRDLADRLDVTSQGALKIIDDMEANGYLARRNHPEDARAKELVLTKRGAAALAAARAFHRRFEADLAKRLGKKQVEAARLTLEGVVHDRERSGKSLSLRPV